jgi:NodT family efflux transporter outer membrane factor (OMF) lipoprotein
VNFARPASLTILAAGLAMLAGCTVGPNYRRPATPVPPGFAEPHGATPIGDSELASWWRRFGDPELDKLVNRALAQNLDVETAAARIREARAREAVAGTAGLPEVNASDSASRERISEHAIPIPPTGGSGGQPGQFGLPGSEFNTFRVGFDASWEIDLFGKTRRSVEAARGRTAAAVWDRRDIQVTTAAEVANAYLTLRTLQQRIAIAEAEVERQQRSEQLVRARVRGGLVTGQDLEQQRSQLSAAMAAIPPLRAEADEEIHALGVLTGDTPEALTADLTPPAALPSALPAIQPGIPSDLLRRRPDIRAAERKLAASTADIGVATADLYPRFSLTAAPALVSTALATLLEWGSRNYSTAATLTWPIFNGGRTRGNIAVANALQEQALINYRKAILVALQDVEDALAQVDNERRRSANIEHALATATRAENIAQARHRGGLVTYSDVLQAQASRISLQSQLIESRGAQARDTVALFKALGGGWPEMAQGGAEP